MSLALIHEMKEFRKEIRAELASVKGGAAIDERIAALEERIKALENKYMAMNARLGKRDG